ncbi:MAG TPA: hypothetical protein VGN08_07225 [Solirubrobacteraceae bacterium]
MTSVARYLLAEYLNSRRWAAPFLLLVAGVVVIYAQPPNPVLETAGGAAAFLLLAQCWLALSFLNSQPDDDRQILVATMGGRRFALGRIAGLSALALLASLLTLAYPWIAGRFQRSPSAAELGWVLVANLVCAGAGSALAALFARPAVRSRAVTVLAVTACLVITVPLGLSPAPATANALDTTVASQVPGRFGGTIVAVTAFVLVAIFVSALLWRYRE